MINMFKSCILNTTGKVAEKGNGIGSLTSQKGKKDPWPCQLSVTSPVRGKAEKAGVCSSMKPCSLCSHIHHYPLFSPSTSSQAHCPSSPLQDPSRTRNQPALLQHFGFLRPIQTHALSNCWRRGGEREEQSSFV